MTEPVAEMCPPVTPSGEQPLSLAIARIRRMLRCKVDERPVTSDEEIRRQDELASSPLLRLGQAFQLSSFELDLLTLCAAIELDPVVPALCAAVNQDERLRCPTFRVALEVLPDPHWSAILPEAPLRYWKLLELVSGDSVTASPLRIDESVLHFLMGVPALDQRLCNLTEGVEPPSVLPASYRTHAETMVKLLSSGKPVVVQLQGNAGRGKFSIAALSCAVTGRGLRTMRASSIPMSGSECESLARLWERDAALTGAALLVQVDDHNPGEWEGTATFINRLSTPLLVIGSGSLEVNGHELVRLTIDRPKADEQRALWESALGDRAATLNGELDRVASHFRLDMTSIQAAGSRVLGKVDSGEDDLGALVWDACRHEARPNLEGRAQRVETRAAWKDIVLPEASVDILRAVAAHVRQQGKVFEHWGFGYQSRRGMGITALFCGGSGCGKTLAAEVLANELHLDLYRIDLSQVVNKYVGETEKNLRAVFDGAENSGAVLLFDEADALFGKRSEVNDSHDRYANIEVSYLLQRMEAYQGLAILTTNMRTALDSAFLRRIRFVVNFPFPDQGLRRRIWERMFPAQTPTEGLELDKLARLNLPGGNIRNVALNAAFLAADEGCAVRMDHLLTAARRECTKLEKPLAGAEIGGWA